jgi:outer membrane protein assembly factor BamB
MLLACCIVSAVALAARADWPQFRGAGGLGVSTETGLPVSWSADENVVWKTPLPGAGGSSPVILGDRIFLTGFTGYNVPGEPQGSMEDLKRYVLCLGRGDGKILWRTEVESRLPEQTKIRTEHGYASNTPVTDGERLYVFFGKSGVFAFDLAGKQLWHADVGSKIHGWGSAASPIVHGDLVIVNASVESASIVGLDRKNGREVWRTDGIKEAWNTPLLVSLPGGKAELVVAMPRQVVGLDPASGERLWSCDTGIRWYMVPCMTAHEGVIYCAGGRSNDALAVRAGGRGDVTATHRLWQLEKGSNVPSLLYHDGHVYWAHESGEAFCVDAKTGAFVYQHKLPRSDLIYPSPILAGGNIYYMSRRGRTFVVPVGPEFKVLATNELGREGMFHASPAVAGGRLFIRADKALFCIGK